ncbi:MAG: winged helix-turn-helix domain-containing protein [Promethearchaeota archaeon]
MTVPKYDKMLLPLLEMLEDNEIHTLRDAYEHLKSHFRLSVQDLNELTPSGRAKFPSRLSWAKTYLEKAGLLKSVGYGKFQITESGRELLRQNITEITLETLENYPSFLEFRYGYPDRTPAEIFETSYQEIREKLAQELIEKIKECSQQFLEHLVIDLLLAMGYGEKLTKEDEIIVVKQDKLGLDLIYIQVKKSDENIVDEKDVQTFSGSLEPFHPKKGVFITTSRFSEDAKKYVKSVEKKIVLIDGDYLANLMIDYKVGVQEIMTYKIKKIDNDYFLTD